MSSETTGRERNMDRKKYTCKVCGKQFAAAKKTYVEMYRSDGTFVVGDCYCSKHNVLNC